MIDPQDFVLAALEHEGRLQRSSIDEARRYAAETGLSVGEAIVQSGLISPREYAIVRAETCETPYVDLSQYEIDYSNTVLLARATAEALGAFPLFVLGSTVTVGMADPLDLRAVDQLRLLLKAEVEAVLCEPGALRGLIERAYAIAGDAAATPEAPAGTGDAASLTTGKEPIVAAVNQIIAQAVERGASDVHIGPDEHDLHLRFRIDGTLQTQQGPGLAAHAGIIRRLKVMANLDLTQTRRPQDGKFRFAMHDKAIDVRLSIVPTVCGENAVMRLMTSNAAIRGFAELGMAAEDSEQIERAMASPHGMLLVTGPTGSGKTTTVYTALKKLNVPDRNIITIEDPVEVRMPLIRQVQVNGEIGMTFAGALRSILRQDPDVVFVGEIRDEETARIAVQAALTGHFVLSTLHTNDAAGAIPRLRDFGCPGFAINAALLCTIAQRLVKRVCPECARAERPAASVAALFGVGVDEPGLVRGAGCARCSNSGYRGRLGVYEVLGMSQPVRRAIDQNGDVDAVRRASASAGMKPMWKDGLAKSLVGLTTLEEVARVVAICDDADGAVDEPAMRAAA